MKHSIRQRVINEYGLPVVKIEQINGELGSGVFDKNGQEIFENDLVKNTDGKILPITFENGNFYIGEYVLAACSNRQPVEIVGHVGD